MPCDIGDVLIGEGLINGDIGFIGTGSTTAEGLMMGLILGRWW